MCFTVIDIVFTLKYIEREVLFVLNIVFTVKKVFIYVFYRSDYVFYRKLN